jgi:hypothetical protein
MMLCRKGDDDLGADPLQAVDSAEDADGGDRRVRVAEGEGVQRQAPVAAFDLAQRPRLEGDAGTGRDAVYFVQFVNKCVGHCGLFRRSVANCHRRENLLQHWRAIVAACHQLPGGKARHEDLHRPPSSATSIAYFDESWVVIWQLDDF